MKKRNCSRRKPWILPLLLIMILSLTGVLSGCGNRNKNEVRVFMYGDYIDPEVVKDFQKETGIKVVLDTFDTNEEMYPIIKNRAGVYDVVCASDYMVERMRKEGLLQKLDFSKIPEAKNIGKRYLRIADRSYDPGNKYSIPYQFGCAGILYNTKKIPKGSITSWSDLWNKKYSGRILMQDSLRDTLMVGLKKNGYSLNTTKRSELSKAVKDLVKQKPLVYKYVNDSARDLLVGGSADIGVIWNGEMLYCQELNPDLAFVVPKEGTEMFIDALIVPKNAFHPDNAMKFINYLSRPETAKKNFEYLTYCTPNVKAQAMLDESIRDNEELFLPESMMKKSEVLRDLGPEGDDLYSEYWKEFKSN